MIRENYRLLENNIKTGNSFVIIWNKKLDKHEADFNIIKEAYNYSVLTEEEKLYTSGMGGIYPKGIYIGAIEKINETKNITDRSFITKTGVDFENLETVLVIVNQ